MQERRARGRERSTSNQDRERRNEIKMRKKGEKSDREELTRAVGERDKGGSLIYLYILTN